MAIIPLSKGKVSIVDDDMVEPLTAAGRWHYHNGYAMRTKRHYGRKQTTCMHRVILELAGTDLIGL